jgi:hypothetical protein
VKHAASNILDVPNFFWDSEPTLHPLYDAIREYLEIEQRTQVLNERCRVFLDLAEILSDSVADAKMSSITWIIIILIVVSIIVTVTEVSLRFGMIEKSKNDNDRHRGGIDDSIPAVSGANSLDLRGLDPSNANLTVEDLRLWVKALTEQERGTICGADVVGKTFAGV